jgi:hypothetical protein
MLKRWQYLWTAAALLLFGFAITGYLLYGVSVVSLYPLITGLGALIVVARPERFGYIMGGLGVVSFVVAAVAPSEWVMLPKVS